MDPLIHFCYDKQNQFSPHCSVEVLLNFRKPHEVTVYPRYRDGERKKRKRKKKRERRGIIMSICFLSVCEKSFLVSSTV